jgi:hypothetical protein
LHARAAPRPLHCGICVRRLKTATRVRWKRVLGFGCRVLAG